MEPSSIPLIARAVEHGGRTAVVSPKGEFSYNDLLDASARVAAELLGGRGDLAEQRVAFLTARDFDYAAVQWGVWRAGGVAVSLCEVHPPAELAYVISDSGAGLVVADSAYESRLRPVARELGVTFLQSRELARSAPVSLPEINPKRRAMIVYTSGTTGKPKGVVTTHLNNQAQVTALINAWEWSPDDHILHVLPLHHVHGIINVLTCALWSGAKCEMLPGFDPETVWDRLILGNVSLFMAVPTIYVKLISAWEAASPEKRRRMSAACRNLRLTVSGSAALPKTVFDKWRSISGHDMLERYGMTEIGMALSNPLHGRRRPGFVGAPLPGVLVRRVDEKGVSAEPGAPAELQVKGPGVFLEYWNRPEETKSSFVDGWFATGDITVLEEGSFRIFGRKSTDIIKTGGFKVSAWR